MSEARAFREMFRAEVSRWPHNGTVGTDEQLHLWARRELERELRGDRSSLGVHLLAAVLVTYGDASLIELVVNTTPKVDGNTGGMIAFGSNVLSAVLPLPKQLQRLGRQVIDMPAVKAWLAQHQHRLRWDEPSARFVMT